MKKKVTTDMVAIEELITRGVEDIFVKESIVKRLASGVPQRIKFGIDPTGNTIHLGRATVLRKLRAFQDMGHTVVLIIGDFTAQIGDPSDKLEKRPMLTKEQIKKNLQAYKKILGKVIDLKKAEFHFNSKWLAKLGFQQIAELAESFSVQQMIRRANFKERFESGQDISLREFLYPLMQGYDSVAIKADIEIGGFDQLFNLKAGRIIQRHYGIKEQDVLTTTMLEGTDGRKMSTSWGNVVNITDEPFDMYGKLMAVHDGLIYKYFLLCTPISVEELNSYKDVISANPKLAKMRLAKMIVALYHGDARAEEAEAQWKHTFESKGIPTVAKKIEVKIKAPMIDLLVEHGLVSSRSEFVRLVKEGAIKFIVKEEERKIIDPKTLVEESGALKIGKKKFVTIQVIKKK